MLEVFIQVQLIIHERRFESWYGVDVAQCSIGWLHMQHAWVVSSVFVMLLLYFCCIIHELLINSLHYVQLDFYWLYLFRGCCLAEEWPEVKSKRSQERKWISTGCLKDTYTHIYSHTCIYVYRCIYVWNITNFRVYPLKQQQHFCNKN